MRKYYCSYSDEKYGPFTLEELKKKRIRSNSLIWCEEAGGWKKAEDIPELKEIVKDRQGQLTRKRKLSYTREEITVNISKLFFNIALLISLCVVIYIYGIIYSELSKKDLIEICALWIIPAIFGISGYISILIKYKKPYIPAFVSAGIIGLIILIIT